MGDRIAVIDHGKVRQVGTPAAIYDDPADRFVATFVGTPPMNLVALERRTSRLSAGAFPAQGDDRGRAHAPNSRSASIVPSISAPSGSSMARSTVFDSAQEVTAKLPPAHVPIESIRPGEWHAFAVRNAALCYFDSDGKRAQPPLSMRWHIDGCDRRETAPERRSPLAVCARPGGGARADPARSGDPLHPRCSSAVPFLLAVYYSLSAYTIYNPSYHFVGLRNFIQVVQNPVFRQTLANTFIFTFGSLIIGLILGKFGALLLLRPFPGRRDRAGADHPALGGADRARHRRLGVDVRFALQRHQLDADRARADDPGGRAELARRSAPGDAVRDHRQCLAFLSVCDCDLSRRHHRGPAGRARRGDGRRRRFLASQLPDHRADDRADRGRRPDLRHRVYVYRSFHRLSPDHGRPGQRNLGPGLSRASRSASSPATYRTAPPSRCSCCRCCSSW